MAKKQLPLGKQDVTIHLAVKLQVDLAYKVDRLALFQALDQALNEKFLPDGEPSELDSLNMRIDGVEATVIDVKAVVPGGDFKKNVLKL